jgi:hypothetical protein
MSKNIDVLLLRLPADENQTKNQRSTKSISTALEIDFLISKMWGILILT